MSWKPAFKFRDQEELGLNGQAFATQEEALASAQARFMVWIVPEDYTAVESDEPVNYKWSGYDEPVQGS